MRWILTVADFFLSFLDPRKVDLILADKAGIIVGQTVPNEFPMFARKEHEIRQDCLGE